MSNSPGDWLIVEGFDLTGYSFLYKYEDEKFPTMLAGVIAPEGLSERILHWIERTQRPRDVLASPEFREKVLVVVKGKGGMYRIISFDGFLSSLEGYQRRLNEECLWIRGLVGEWGRRGRRWKYSPQDLTRICVFRLHYSHLPLRETYLLLNIPLIRELFRISQPPYYFLLERLNKMLKARE